MPINNPWNQGNEPAAQQAAAPAAPPPAPAASAVQRIPIQDANAALPSRLTTPQSGGYNFANPYQGADPYAEQRKIATDAAQGAGAQGLDAITRRYAAMGNLNSGSYTQALADNSRNTQAATEQAVSGLNAQQNQQAQQESQFGRQIGEQESQYARGLDLGQNQQLMDQWANQVNAQTAAKQSSGGK